MPSFVDVAVALVWIATRNDEVTSHVRHSPKRERAVERALASAETNRRAVWTKLVQACAAGKVRAVGTLVEADGSIVPRMAIPETLWPFLRIDEEGDYVLAKGGHRWQALKFDAEGLRHFFPPGHPVTAPEAQETAPQSQATQSRKEKRVEDAVVAFVREKWPSGKPRIPAKKRNDIISEALNAMGVATSVSESTILRALRRVRAAKQ
jgi:hypothetical protein